MNNDKIKTFKDLRAWQDGHRLVLFIYKLTENFPKNETYSLTDQMRRSVVSITANIAEGFSRQSHKERLRFYLISKGSITELENQILIARDINYINSSQYDEILKQIITVHKLLNAFINTTKLRILEPPISNLQFLTSKGGFSLMELLIYVAVLVIVTAVISGFFLAINKGRGQVSARTEVNQNIRFALSAIERDLSAASSVTAPGTAGATSSVLTLTSGGNTITYATTTLNRLQRTVNSLSDVITSERVKIDSLSFVRLENINAALGKTFLSVEASMGVSYDSESPDWQYAAGKKTTVGIRN